MMRRMKMPFSVALLLAVIACDQSQESMPNMETKQTYSLCPIRAGSRPRLHTLVEEFANKYQARIIDRSAEAQGELAGMKKGADILDHSAEDLIMLTVEIPNDLRVSLSNLGLREKVALTVRHSKAGVQDVRVAALLANIGRFWRAQPVEGGVLDDPPCMSD